MELKQEIADLITYLDSLSKREGRKPMTVGPAPHTQTEQFPESKRFSGQLHDFIMTFDGVYNGLSHIGDGGLYAYFIKSEHSRSGFSERFLIDNEFAHIHRHPSKSLHLVLPVKIGKQLEEKNWVENHPLAVSKAIPATNFMLFGSRNEQELSVSKHIARLSYLFATKQLNE